MLITPSIIFYVRLSWTLALGMLVISAIRVALIVGYMKSFAVTLLWAFAILLFIIAWIGQFISRHIEDKKPVALKTYNFY